MSSRAGVDLCVSQHFNKLSKEQMKQFISALTLAEPSVVGSCDGACWMRQVSEECVNKRDTAYCKHASNTYWMCVRRRGCMCLCNRVV